MKSSKVCSSIVIFLFGTFFLFLFEDSESDEEPDSESELDEEDPEPEELPPSEDSESEPDEEDDEDDSSSSFFGFGFGLALFFEISFLSSDFSSSFSFLFFWPFFAGTIFTLFTPAGSLFRQLSIKSFSISSFSKISLTSSMGYFKALFIIHLSIPF